MSQVGRDLVAWLEKGLREVERWEPFMAKLTPWEAGAIAAGTLDRINRPLEPEWATAKDGEEAGWIKVRANFWIQPHPARKTNKGYGIWFNVRDWRSRLIRRVPPMFEPPEMDDYGEPIPPTLEAIERARQSGSYTTSNRDAVTDAGDAVDDADQTRFIEAAQMHRAQASNLAQLRRERYELDQRLRRAQADAMIRGVDISSPLRVIERQLEKIERRIHEGRAA